mmetsp:Transcript_95032/g.156856  ORF Transcript_95032/g.156856 Transcript_95032/m.156856 type:complete len:110 (+) Transcript_95032:236-565(+)
MGGGAVNCGPLAFLLQTYRPQAIHLLSQIPDSPSRGACDIYCSWGRFLGDTSQQQQQKHDRQLAQQKPTTASTMPSTKSKRPINGSMLYGSPSPSMTHEPSFQRAHATV